MINSINIHKHRVEMPNYESRKGNIADLIQSHLSHAELDIVDMFNMGGTTSGLLSGSKKRLVILAHHLAKEEDSIVIEQDGVELASYTERDNSVNQLNIYLDLFTEENAENESTFRYILNELNTRVFLQKILDYSWKSTSKKEELTAEFTGFLKQQQQSYLNDDKIRLSQTEQDIIEWTRSLKNAFDKRTRYLANIENAEARLDALGGKIITELDNIVAHPKVKEMFIRDGIIEVHTEPIYAYHDQTGERYYIGNMGIKMNPQNTEVKFFGDNPRRSVWSEKDPHPHVSHSGNACLGNVAATIAELCSQMELYALTMVAIDFLENVNTSDSAGKKIVNWDMVDEEGKIIKLGRGQEKWTCNQCGDEFNNTYERTTVYRHIQDGSLADMRQVCRDCLEDYHWSDHFDAYIHNEYDEDDYMEEE